jgi:hypothetical protein
MAEVNLSINPIEGFPGNWQVVITGTNFRPNEEVKWRLKGEDTFLDDRIVWPTGFGTVGSNGNFQLSENTIGGNLNEDWGEDDIYAIVTMGQEEYRSNTVHGHY